MAVPVWRARPVTAVKMNSEVSILLVDDRPENLLALETMLEQPEYRLVKAHSGREALKQLLQEEEFAVIILDVRMTEIDGFETASILQEREKTRRTPIIFLTAYGQNHDQILRGYSLGAVDYLFNPPQAAILRAKVAVFVELFKKTRELQRQAAQLKASNQELESFCYSVSHDLRAPLRHIDGFVEMLRQASGSTLSDTCRRYLDAISDSGKRLDRLIEDLLRFSRITHAELRQTRVSMDDLVTEVLLEMSRESEGRNIQWGISPLPEVFADRSLLKLVWLNLLSNALKYTRPRDPATIQVGCRQTDVDFEFYVKDNGIGMDMRYADKLFCVFQRLHLANEFEGTGIGLAVVRRIISRHQGRTWADGQVNVGAIFYFTLPILSSNRW